MYFPQLNSWKIHCVAHAECDNIRVFSHSFIVSLLLIKHINRHDLIMSIVHSSWSSLCYSLTHWGGTLQICYSFFDKEFVRKGGYPLLSNFFDKKNRCFGAKKTIFRCFGAKKKHSLQAFLSKKSWKNVCKGGEGGPPLRTKYAK